MYVRASRSGDRTYLRLVESYRADDGKIRQRQVAQLGRADELAGDRIERLIASLRRHTGSGGTDADRVEFEPAREVGAPWLLTELWQELGIDRVLTRALRSSRRQFNAEAAVRAMVFNRLCDPESKLGVLRWLDNVVLPGVDTDALNHQRLLRSMDALIEERRDVEQAMGTLLRPLIDQELSVVFYDLTSVRIHGEGEVEGDVRHFGRSKDVHGVARQCVLGLIQTADGLPLDFELFDGNVAEVTTLLPMLERIFQRYTIHRVVIVADRGLLSLDNIEQIEAMTLPGGQRPEYILAVPAGRYSDFADVIDRLSFASEVPSIRESTVDGRRMVVAHDPQAQQEKQRRRREKIQELVAFGDQLTERLDHHDAGHSGRGRPPSDHGAYVRFQRAVMERQYSRYFHMAIEDGCFTFEVNEDAVSKAERLDGKLVLLTNVTDLGAEDVVARYKALADIERGFRVLKRDLEIAPVYHRLPERIRAHAMICFLSLLLHRVLRMRLKAGNLGMSVERALEKLQTIQYHQVRVEHETLTGLSRMTPEQKSLFDGLEVSRPEEKRL